MKVYIAGKITGLENYKEYFDKAEKELIENGYVVLKPSILPYPGFEHHEYMHVCKAMIDICDMVYFLKNWHDSDGAKAEMQYAMKTGKDIWLDDYTLELINSILGGMGDESNKPFGVFRGINTKIK